MTGSDEATRTRQWSGGTPGDLSDALIERSVWTDDMLAGAGIPVREVPFVTVGGGLGSFSLVDYLRIGGVPAASIAVLSATDRPWETYAYLAKNSQIPDHERLRSDSGSVMDNIWGFPSYAIREAFAARTLRGFIAPVWNVATEPLLADYYTPQAGQVYRSVDRECRRIGWDSMLVRGQVRMVRRRADGGYFVILTPPAGTTPTKRVAYRTTHVHIAVGYPGVRFLPDLQEYRAKYSDYGHVVNAYEPHDFVYEELRARPGVVVVRGAGIVASRILQRLLDDRERHGAQTTVWHLFRNYVDGPHGPRFARRPGADGFAYQAFNFPKAAWGGQLRDALLRLPPADRPDFIKTTGGTNTAPRASWKQQLERGRRGGWYRTYIGEVEEVTPGRDGDGTRTRIRSDDGAVLELDADVIIDATGLEAGIKEHRLLADLLDHCGAVQNPLGRLDTGRDFELTGTASSPGRMYASGSITLGSWYSPVDSFLGLQYAALQISGALARQGLGRRIRTLRSVREWWKWMRNRPV